MRVMLFHTLKRGLFSRFLVWCITLFFTWRLGGNIEKSYLIVVAKVDMVWHVVILAISKLLIHSLYYRCGSQHRSVGGGQLVPLLNTCLGIYGGGLIHIHNSRCKEAARSKQSKVKSTKRICIKMHMYTKAAKQKFHKRS